MKYKIQRCEICKEDTIHDIGKKQATSKRGAYLRRSTKRCRKCGTKEIYNVKKKERKLIKGENESKQN